MTERVIKSPGRAHIASYSPSRNYRNTPDTSTSSSLKRRYSSSFQEEDEEEQEGKNVKEPTPTLSRSSTFASDIQTSNSNNARWTTAHWKKLEDWYIRKNRDFRKAANSFYYFESLINIDLPNNNEDNTDGAPVIKELWSLDHILWRSQCLDTSVKFHKGLLPSERKREKRRKLSSDGSTTSNASTSSSSSSTISFKRPATPAARVSSSSRPSTPARATSSKSPTTPIRRIPSYASSSSSLGSFD